MKSPLNPIATTNRACPNGSTKVAEHHLPAQTRQGAGATQADHLCQEPSVVW
jgi:hypothetical protein